MEHTSGHKLGVETGTTVTPMCLLIGAGLLYCDACDVSIKTGAIYRRLLCYLEPLDFLGLQCSESLDVSPLDGDDETEPRRCSILITGIPFSLLL